MYRISQHLNLPEAPDLETRFLTDNGDLLHHFSSVFVDGERTPFPGTPIFEIPSSQILTNVDLVRPTERDVIPKRNIDVASNLEIAAFDSESDFLQSDTNNVQDVFISNLSGANLARISVLENGREFDDDTRLPDVSDDGEHVIFGGSTTVGNEPVTGLFVNDFGKENQELYNVGATTSNIGPREEPIISDFGQFVTHDGGFINTVVAHAQPLVADDLTQAPAFARFPSGANPEVEAFSMSESGRYVAASVVLDDVTAPGADDLPNFDPAEFDNRLMVFDLLTGETDRIEPGDERGSDVINLTQEAISSDGRFIAFTSEASNLVPQDTNNVADVFVWDRENDSIERVSVSNNGQQGNGESSNAVISDDGDKIAFATEATNLRATQADDRGSDFIIAANEEVEGKSLSLDSLALAEAVASTYIGYFGRPPSGEGARFWIERLVKDATPAAQGGNGLSFSKAVTNALDSFSASEEATTKFSFLATQSNDVDAIASFVNEVFSNLFNRTPEGTPEDSSTGLGFWTNEIQEAVNVGPDAVGDVIFNILFGASGDDGDVVTNKISAAERFAQVVDVHENEKSDPIGAGESIIESVGGSEQSVSEAYREIRNIGEHLPVSGDLVQGQSVDLFL